MKQMHNPMHDQLREQFEARVAYVARAFSHPEVLPVLQCTGWQFGASVDELIAALALVDEPLSKDYRRWAGWKAAA